MVNENQEGQEPYYPQIAQIKGWLPAAKGKKQRPQLFVFVNGYRKSGSAAASTIDVQSWMFNVDKAVKSSRLYITENIQQI
jgi:hypothetical protein